MATKTTSSNKNNTPAKATTPATSKSKAQKGNAMKNTIKELSFTILNLAPSNEPKAFINEEGKAQTLTKEYTLEDHTTERRIVYSEHIQLLIKDSTGLLSIMELPNVLRKSIPTPEYPEPKDYNIAYSFMLSALSQIHTDNRGHIQLPQGKKENYPEENLITDLKKIINQPLNGKRTTKPFTLGNGQTINFYTYKPTWTPPATTSWLIK